MSDKEKAIYILTELSKADKRIMFPKKDIAQALDMAIEALEQELKTGHWIKYSIPRCGEQHYKCTSCGYYINFGQWGELYTKEFQYCPNCGVRMEGEEK